MTEHTAIEEILRLFRAGLNSEIEQDIKTAHQSITTYLQQEIDKARIDELNRASRAFENNKFKERIVSVYQMYLKDRIATIRERSE